VKEHGNCDIHGIVDMTKQRLSFTLEEKDRGKKELRAMGIPHDKPFICFHARDGTYLSKTYPEKDWSYHNYRNVNIENYSLCVQRLIDLGYYAVRMGSIVEKSFFLTAPGIIDYACGQMRSDFLDLYLLSKCYFFINSENGIGAVSRLFRRPAVCVNQIPMDYMAVWDPNYIVICKKLWLKGQKRFLTFREILKSDIGRLRRSEDYEKRGIEIVQNTPEEIWDAAEEMLERLQGRWNADNDHEELQRRFWSLYEPNELHGVIKAHMGSKFLEQNVNLLD
jgi:putative glycosyltransferase (TIGR04372 family)